MDTKEEATAYLIQKGYWRIVKMGDPKQGYMKVEACDSDKSKLLLLQQTFGGIIKKQDSIWRWFCGKSADIAFIALSLIPHARALSIEMHRYVQCSGERRHKYVQAIQEKYKSTSIKLSEYTDKALEGKDAVLS